jgi:ankyrin repeat protein
MAVEFDHASTVKLLVERGASIECRDARERTPLISGSINGSKSIENLLDAGADVNAFDDYGSTALHRACDRGHETVVKQLLGSGAQYRKDNNGRLPLHNAVNHASSEPIVQLLLQHFPDSVNERNVNGRTALHSAAFKGHLPLVNLLLENGADMEIENNLGEIPLDYAVYSGSEPIVQLLLQQSPRTIKARAKNGETLLHCAVREGHLSIMKLLLMTEPTLLEAADNTDETALFLAVSMGRKESIEFLLQHGCQLTLRDIDGAAPWDFIQAKFPTSEIIDLLVTYGWDMDERYYKGFTMFHVAVTAGNEEGARSLISHGCNIEIGDNDGDTPLNNAIMLGNANMQTLIREVVETQK